MHEEVLNAMLANTCHNESLVVDGVIKQTEFTFDLHCVEVKVVARFVGDWEKDDVRYEVISWKMESI